MRLGQIGIKVGTERVIYLTLAKFKEKEDIHVNILQTRT